MLVILLVGWLVVLPAVIVLGLCVGARRREQRPPATPSLEQLTAFATKGRRAKPAPLVGAGSTGH